MCGICGVISLDGSPAASAAHVRAMSEVIYHRGPDDSGSHFAGPAAFGFRRLSIVDLATGHQPMSNEDGTVWIIFNGEIYNHATLRPDLEQRGHRYSTRSDTETIVHLYEEYGDDCVHHLRGMFALVIWDARKQRIFAARDRLGIKPFYYAIAGGKFIFGSEIKALFQYPGVRPERNARVLPEFFALGYISSDETMFAGVRKLLPGHRMSLDLSRDAPPTSRAPRIERYWDLDITPDRSISSEKDYIRRFEELFTESIRLRLMSDVPLGVFLSGGLDSSAIAAVMSRLHGEQIKTFSVGYTDDEYSELPWARQVAAHLGAEYNQVLLGPGDFFDLLPRMVWHEDEPLVWPSSVALHAVSRLAREKVTVVLTGEGGDELFAGYLKYRATLWNLRYGPLYRALVPSPLRRLAARTLDARVLPASLARKLRHTFLYRPADFEHMYFDNWYSVFPQQMHSELFTPALAAQVRDTSAYVGSMAYFSGNGGPDTLLSRLLYLDIKTYLVELLMKQDQMSMAASIESRVPFLDHKLVEFAMRIPPEHKVRYLAGKHLLKKAMENLLPSEVIHRRKMGFPTPVKPWLRNQLFDRVSRVLCDGRLESRGLLNAIFIRDLLDAHRRGRADATDAIWRLVNFELWNRVFFDGERPQRAPDPRCKTFAAA